MRRRQKEKWKKILVLACSTAVLVFGLRALAGLVRSAWQRLVPENPQIAERIGEGLLLEDRALFSYLRFHEEERGPFRFISERILCHNRYVIAADGAETEEKKTGGTKEKEDGQKEGNKGSGQGEEGEKRDGEKDGIPESSADGEKNEKDEAEVFAKKDDMAGKLAQLGESGRSTGNGVPGGNTGDGNVKWADADEDLGQEPEDFSASVTEGLLESVMSENAAYGNYLPVSYAKGDVLPAAVLPQTGESLPEMQSGLAAKLLIENNYSMPKLADPNYLISTYYIVDSGTSTLPELFDGKALLEKELGIDPVDEGGYQILIYHTHASEGYADSRSGEVLDTVRGPGEALAEYLRGYGYTVYHDMTAYDRKDGKDNRNQAYSTARPQIEAFLEEHPEVQVVIDLHRDSGARRAAVVNGKATAQVMLFNGLCRNASGPIDYLDNPNLSSNLAFSLQTNLVGRVLYPNLMFRIYLKNYRYNQHFVERCMLIELGTDQNTVEEAYNAMEPLANILDTVLRK